MIYISVIIFLQEDAQRDVMVKERERKETEIRILKDSRSVGAAKDLHPTSPTQLI